MEFQYLHVVSLYLVHYSYLYTFCDKVRWAGPEKSDLSRKSALCVIVCIHLTTNCAPFLIVFVRHRLSELFRPFQVENMICLSRCFQGLTGFLVAGEDLGMLYEHRNGKHGLFHHLWIDHEDRVYNHVSICFLTTCSICFSHSC